ncbi:MAG: hypothetical protein BWK80_31065 [Desulfobacteraceae bacterium IS3]|nr:MAG: hypothetical protein BWK80_31065 [Desulfobacteraceae bacterium IS3]
MNREMKKYILPLLAVMIVSGCATVPEDEPFTGDTEIRRAGEATLITAAKSNNARLIASLLLGGSDINMKDNQGKSALQHAFEAGNFEAFKILLESGASADFPLTYEAAATAYKKMKLYKLAKEYQLIRQIKMPGKNTDLSLFDAYFSEFPNGSYTAEAERIFKEVIKSDYQKAGSLKELQRFAAKYSNLGKNCYLIIGSGLNVRSDSGLNAKKTGGYLKGEQVFAIARKEGWIQTDRGWISTEYVKPVNRSIPTVQTYLRAVEKKIVAPSKKSDSQIPKTEPRVPKSERQTVEIEPRVPESEPSSVETESRIVESELPESKGNLKNSPEARKELENILKHPTLPKLEEFINKYKDDNASYLLVKKAKEEYKKILLHE